MPHGIFMFLEKISAKKKFKDRHPRNDTLGIFTHHKHIMNTQNLAMLVYDLKREKK